MAEHPERLADLLAQARANLGMEASPEASKRLEERLQAVAAELALEWITGERRFENQSQQTEHWLARIYEEMFPDEQPDAARIYTRFNLPLPRAQYLARLLLARRTSQWRSAARREVVAALDGIAGKAREAEAAKAARTQRFDLSLSRGGFEELMVRYNLLVGGIAAQDRPAPPRRDPSSAALVWFSVTAETALRLLAAIPREAA
jgi:hypothetical protein